MKKKELKGNLHCVLVWILTFLVILVLGWAKGRLYSVQIFPEQPSPWYAFWFPSLDVLLVFFMRSMQLFKQHRGMAMETRGVSYWDTQAHWFWDHGCDFVAWAARENERAWISRDGRGLLLTPQPSPSPSSLSGHGVTGVQKAVQETLNGASNWLKGFPLTLTLLSIYLQPKSIGFPLVSKATKSKHYSLWKSCLVLIFCYFIFWSFL